MIFTTLFLTSFASATLLPGGSEALLLYLLSEQYQPLLLIASASIGNILGSYVNYLLGVYGVNFARSKQYISEEKIDKAQILFEKYGAWSLLFSWAPIIGDPLTLVAGILHYRWWKFLVIVSFAKIARYSFIYLGFLALTQ
ncbi:MAG: DedA family protein [Sulfurospirillaceae bacterium]|nr:DedA family protein [Sulfurospirillaceae bacterium]MDD2826826.1 DedA family protein [Sulfurospirillaceae bacterium]